MSNTRYHKYRIFPAIQKVLLDRVALDFSVKQPLGIYSCGLEGNKRGKKDISTFFQLLFFPSFKWFIKRANSAYKMIQLMSISIIITDMLEEKRNSQFNGPSVLSKKDRNVNERVKRVVNSRETWGWKSSVSFKEKRKVKIHSVIIHLCEILQTFTAVSKT